jgi:hypothetical protein
MNIDYFPVPGGYSQPKEATEEVQSICDNLKSEVETTLGKTFSTFRASIFHTQVVRFS